MKTSCPDCKLQHDTRHSLRHLIDSDLETLALAESNAHEEVASGWLANHWLHGALELFGYCANHRWQIAGLLQGEAAIEKLPENVVRFPARGA